MVDYPLVNWPEKSGGYKVVQFDSDEYPYLRFSIKSKEFTDFHQFILERFAREIGVECTKISGLYGLIPALPTNVPYRMIGAGICDLNLEKHIATFGGNSRDYTIGINQDHLQRFMMKFPEWQIR
nr:hypothetical protein [Candidatus Woesearchaeota archaeon]